MARGRPKLGPNYLKETKITCRFCGPKKAQILLKNCRAHLRTAHNDETGNIREWGSRNSSELEAEASHILAVGARAGVGVQETGAIL